MRNRLYVAMTLLLMGSPGMLALLPQAASAQHSRAPEEPKIGCFRGRPLPHCRSLWIVEMQASIPLAQTRRSVVNPSGPVPRRDAFETVLEWNVGHLVNLTSDYAVGGEVTVGTGNDDALTGVKARGRRWLTPDLSLELEAGIVRSNARDTQFPGLTGPTVGVRLNLRDQGAVYFRWDGISIPEESNPATGYHDPGGTQHALSMGGAVGSLPALVGTGAVGIAMAVLIAVFVSQST